MHCQLRRTTAAVTAVFRSYIVPSNSFSSFPLPKQIQQLHPVEDRNQRQAEVVSDSTSRIDHGSLIGSKTRIQKLIASQSDPLLAKEIFDYASMQPNFRHSRSSYLILILKLGRARYFKHVDEILSRLKSDRSPVPGNLFTYLIKIYAEASLPDKALRTFYTMLEFNHKPTTKHLNRILETLVSHRSHLRSAFELFKSARHYEVLPNTKSYNIMMRAFCLNGELSIAYQLFGKMLERDVVPDVESYRILIQGMCRKGQVNGAVGLLEDMLYKGFVPDGLSYTTLLNSLCRKKQLREAYKLLCRMKIKGCNPDIIHYNTLILGVCREGRAMDAQKVLEDMESNGCLPDLVSYRTLITGLCDQGLFDEGKRYLDEMVSKGFSPHFSLSHDLVKGFCGVGKVEQMYDVVERVVEGGGTLHLETWGMIVPSVCREDEVEKVGQVLDKIRRVEITEHTRIVEAGGVGLGDYLLRKFQSEPTNR